MFTVTHETTTLYTVAGHATLDYDEARARQIETGAPITLEVYTGTVYTVGGRRTVDHDEAMEWSDADD